MWGGKLREGKEGEFPLGSRDKTGRGIWGAETGLGAHIAVPPPDKQSFHGNWGYGGGEDYAYPPYRLHHQITCQIMALICILSTRNLDQIGNEWKWHLIRRLTNVGE